MTVWMYRQFIFTVIVWCVVGIMAVSHIALLIECKPREQHSEQDQQQHLQQLRGQPHTPATTPVPPEPTPSVKLVDGLYRSYFPEDVLPTPRGLNEEHLALWKTKGKTHWEGMHAEVWAGTNFTLPIPIANCGMNSNKGEFMVSSESVPDGVQLKRVAVALAPEAWSWQHFMQDVMPKIVVAAEAVGGLAGLSDREFLLPHARDPIVYEIMDFLRLRYADEPRPPMVGAYVLDGLVACKVPGNLINTGYNTFVWLLVTYVYYVMQVRTPGYVSACTSGYIYQSLMLREAPY